MRAPVTSARPLPSIPRSVACCFIAPPDLLARLADEGTAEQRAAALNALAASASMRTRRAVIGQLLRDPQTREAALALIGAAPGRTAQRARRPSRGAKQPAGQRVWAEGDQPTQDDSVNEAFDGAGKTYDFYEQTFAGTASTGRGWRSSHLSTSATTLTTRS